MPADARRAFALGLLALLSVTCGGGGSSGSSSSSGAARGESCSSRADCAVGLACIKHVCTLDDSGLTPTGKECVKIDCAVPTDCCQDSLPYCSQLQQACQYGDPSACQQLQLYCTCNPQKWACEADHCIELCYTNTDCLQGTCVMGRCAECGSDIDCSSSATCKLGKCVPRCLDSSSCPSFNQCIDGACVETGCSSDRECIAATGNVLAVCRNTECKVPCKSDVECVQPSDDILACIDGFCVSVGCESDEECRLLLGVQAGKGFEAVCRDKSVP